jgi:hypothetical protein
MPTLYSALGIPMDEAALHQHSQSFNARLQIWLLATKAAMLHPLTGFGWGQISQVNFLFAENATVRPGMFNAAHNIFIDLVLWNGYPIGLLLMVVVFAWAIKMFRSVATIKQCCYFLFLSILAIHALLELPLQYAYFLLPWGLIAGAMEASGAKESDVKMRCHWVTLAFVLIGVTVLLVTIRDYSKIETSNYGLRFENAGIVTNIPRTPPKVWVLDQFNEFFLLVRSNPTEGLTNAELDRMRDSVNTVPSAQTMFNLAANLALNGKSQEARHWQLTLCQTMSEINCQEARVKWEHDAYTARTGVAWPVN